MEVINAASLTLNTTLGFATLLPRFEKITKFIDSERSMHELLCTVYLDGVRYNPEEFFFHLNSEEVFDIYMRCVSVAIEAGVKSLCLNSYVDFIVLGCAEKIAREFPMLKFYFEVSEETLTPDFSLLKTYLDVTSKVSNLDFLLDDFGSGGANYSAIKFVDFYGIKISKEFFWDTFYSNANLLVETLQYLRSKAKVLIVEGVDCIEKYLFCRTHDVFMQGRYIDSVRSQNVQ